IQYKSGKQEGPVYSPIPRERQIEAIEFLSQNAFHVPNWLSQPEFSERISYSLTNDTLLNYQMKLLKEIISIQRLNRITMIEHSGEPYKELLKSILGTLSQVLFKDLGADKKINWRAFDLQRTYISLLAEAVSLGKQGYKLKGSINKSVCSGYVQSVFLTELKTLKMRLEHSLLLNENEIIKAHLHLCLDSLTAVQN
ncbi:MAG: zinc-dependent metalloprotease, partial [Gelidibacter sp.]